MVRHVLNQEQKEFYEENGYLVLENVLTGMECDRLVAICERHAENDFPALPNVEAKAPEAYYYIRHPEIVDPVEDLHNGEMVCLGTQTHYKKPGTPFATHAWRPHQDNSYFCARSGVFVSAILALTDADPENGGMYAYAGSHKEDLLPYERHPSFTPGVNPGNEITSIPSQYQKVDLVLKKGSLYIQHGNLVHGSYSNTSRFRARPHIGIMYILRGEQYVLGPSRSKTTVEVLLH